MRGIIALLLVIVAVSAVRSQGPPTRTKSGPPPTRRRNDNPDYGMPSGKDVPDGRRFPARPPPPAPKMPAQKRVTRLRAGKRPPPAAPKMPAPVPKRAAPPKKLAKRPVKVLRRPARPGDNPDYGMPSGKDVPDGRRFVAAPPAQKLPAPKRVTRLRAGKRPRSMPPVVPRRFVPAAPPVALPPMMAPAQPPAFRYSPFAPPAAPYAPPPAPYNPPAAAPPAPCGCSNYYAPVCSVNEIDYDNECKLECDGDVIDCDGTCPCPYAAAPAAPPPPPAAPMPIDDCSCVGQNNKVCAINGEIYDSECHAICEGTAKACDGMCPCDT